MQDSVVEAIRGAGKHVVVTPIVGGGPQLVHPGRGFHAVVGQFPPKVEIVLWLSEHPGEVGRAAQYGSSPDSPLEGDGFEPLVPRHTASSRGRIGRLQLKSTSPGPGQRRWQSRSQPKQK